MRPVILDIGARSKYFARRLKWYNWETPQLIFCGEPYWRPRLEVIDSSRARTLIHSGKRGIFRINSTYQNFKLDNESLDMVTLNGPHILTPPKGIERELLRCLKSGGIFFFSYPVNFGLPHFPPGTFAKIAEGFLGNTSPIDLSNVSGFPRHLPCVIKPSETMRYNIRERARRQTSGYRNPMGVSYIYHGMTLRNGFEVWQKN